MIQIANIQLNTVLQLRDDPLLGDYRNNIVLVEAGPRGIGDIIQYRVSWGSGSGDCDWVDVDLLLGAIKVDACKKAFIYEKTSITTPPNSI